MIGKSYDKIYYVQQYSNGAHITLLQSDGLISNYPSLINFDEKGHVLYWMDQKSNSVSARISTNSCLIYVNMKMRQIGSKSMTSMTKFTQPSRSLSFIFFQIYVFIISGSCHFTVNVCFCKICLNIEETKQKRLVSTKRSYILKQTCSF